MINTSVNFRRIRFHADAGFDLSHLPGKKPTMRKSSRLTELYFHSVAELELYHWGVAIEIFYVRYIFSNSFYTYH
ncbi:hypothetical protein Hanom_Chr17g01581291 [Helianthus anomalus]